MRILLQAGAAVYPLAGEAGVSERIHSSAADLVISAQAVTDLVRRVRAAFAKIVDRGNLSTTITFSTTRLFGTPAAAFLYVLDHDSALPRQGTLIFEALAPGGGITKRALMDMVISPPTRRVIGCTALLDYTATGGAIITPSSGMTVSGNILPTIAKGLYVETGLYNGKMSYGRGGGIVDYNQTVGIGQSILFFPVFSNVWQLKTNDGINGSGEWTSGLPDPGSPDQATPNLASGWYVSSPASPSYANASGTPIITPS